MYRLLSGDNVPVPAGLPAVRLLAITRAARILPYVKAAARYHHQDIVRKVFIHMAIQDHTLRVFTSI